MLHKIFTSALDLRVGETRIRLAYSQKAAAVANREGVVGKQSVALAMAIFDGGDHHVERGKRLFQLEPGPAAASGRVERFRTLYNNALVARSQRVLEGLLNGRDRFTKHRRRRMEWRCRPGGKISSRRTRLFSSTSSSSKVPSW